MYIFFFFPHLFRYAELPGSTSRLRRITPSGPALAESISNLHPFIFTHTDSGLRHIECPFLGSPKITCQPRHCCLPRTLFEFPLWMWLVHVCVCVRVPVSCSELSLSRKVSYTLIKTQTVGWTWIFNVHNVKQHVVFVAGGKNLLI